MPPKKEHCPTCDDWKILTDFTKQTSSWDKLCRMCRTCMVAYKKKDIIYNEKYKSSGRRKEVSIKRYNEKKEIIIKQYIDHIKPISKYNLTDPEDIKNAFNYKNLQPLWASDNLSKSNKYNNK